VNRNEHRIFTWMFSVIALPIVGGLCFKRHEPLSVSECMLFVVLAPLTVWAIDTFLKNSWAADTVSRSPRTDREKLYYNIQAGYRLMVTARLRSLPSGYQDMEDRYVALYGTKSL
jgi:hypothetical protein